MSLDSAASSAWESGCCAEGQREDEAAKKTTRRRRPAGQQEELPGASVERKQAHQPSTPPELSGSGQRTKYVPAPDVLRALGALGALADPSKSAGFRAQGRNRTADTGIFNPLTWSRQVEQDRQVKSARPTDCDSSVTAGCGEPVPADGVAVARRVLKQIAAQHYDAWLNDGGERSRFMQGLERASA